MKPADAGRLGSSTQQAVSQIRGVGTAVGHAQTRVLSSAIQTITSVPLSLGTVGSQGTLKQVNVPRTGLSAASPVSSTITLSQGSTMVTARSALSVPTSTNYHVPRGAAAVANIAAPRSAVATPMVRATAATHTSSFVSGLRGLGPNSLAPRVSSPATSGTTWLSGTAVQSSTAASAVPKAVSPRPRVPSITTIPAYTQGRPTSMTVTARPITPQVSQSPRTQLLHASAQKSITGTQLHITENNYFKQGVSVQSALSGVGIAQVLPARTYSTSPSPVGTTNFSATGCGQGTATLITTQPHQITLSQGLAGQARLTATSQGTVLTATTAQRPGHATAVLSPPPRIVPPASPVRLPTSVTASSPVLAQQGGGIAPLTGQTRPTVPGQTTAVLTGATRLTVAAPPSSAAAPVQARLAASTVAAGQPGTTVSVNQTRLVTSGGPSIAPGQGQGAASARLTVSAPSQIHQGTTVLPAQARIAVPNSALAAAGVVSLHPMVVSNTATTIPLKPAGHTQLGTSTNRTISTHQALGSKPFVQVIAQPVHGPSIQITQVPVSSVTAKIPPALTITTGGARPVTYTATTTVAGNTVSNLRPVTVATSSTIPVAKVFPQATPVSEVTLQAQPPAQATSVYIQTSHRQSPAPSSSQVSVERAGSMLPTYSLPTYYYEPPSAGYQVTSMVARPYTPGSPYAVQTTATTAAASPALRTGVATHQVHGTLVQPDNSVVGQNSPLQPVSKPNASPRPSILRKRDNEGSPMKAQKNLNPVLASLAGPVSPPSPRRPDSRGNGGISSGGSTTISATSSPGLGEAGEDSLPPIKQEPVEEGEKSPRKKPRKQQLHGNELHEPKFSEDEMEFISEEKIKKEVKEVNTSAVLCVVPEESGEKVFIPKRPNISLINSYRYTWKSRHNHYLRYSDVKPKDERRPTVTDLANQKQVLQKVNGWKIHHLSTQMEDLADLETQVFEKLTAMLKVMEKRSGKDLDRDVNRVNELIKGNMQRSKVIKDQMEEAKCQVMKIFDHKCHVTDIISRCANKRSMKKREKS